MTGIFGIVLLTLMAQVPEAQVESDRLTDIRETLDAYQTARDFGDKQTAFSLAETAYDKARRQARDHPDILLQARFAYGLAGLDVREPAARDVLLGAVDDMQATPGANPEAFLAPLTSAAEDALWRDRPTIAYSLFNRVRDQLHTLAPAHPLIRARVEAGIATLYLEAGDLTRAQPAAETALDALSGAAEGEEIANQIATRKKISDIFMALGLRDRAEPILLRAYSDAQAVSSVVEERVLRSLLHRIVALYAEQNRPDRVVEFCHRYIRHDFKVTSSPVIFDPSNRLSPSLAAGRTRGELHARFDVGLDCRPINIEVVATKGLSHEEAREILAGTVYLPLADGREPTPRTDAIASYFVAVN